MGKDQIDISLFRDKDKNFAALEFLCGSITAGSAFGITSFGQHAGAPIHSRFYSTSTIQDTFLISLNKADIERTIDNQRRRKLNDQLNYLRTLEAPNFKVLSRNL